MSLWLDLQIARGHDWLADALCSIAELREDALKNRLQDAKLIVLHANGALGGNRRCLRRVTAVPLLTVSTLKTQLRRLHHVPQA